MTTPSRRIAAGYDASGRANTKAETARVAGAFRYDPRLEQLATLAEKDPARYDRLSPTRRMELGFYASAKAAAEACGIDTSAPKDTP